MLLRLCIECGSRLHDPLHVGPCAVCLARAPAWKAVPLSLRDVLRRLALVSKIAGALAIPGAFLLAAWALFAFPGELVRVLQVVLVAAAFLAVLPIYAYAGAYVWRVLEREHRHDEREGGRRGVAYARFGRMVRGHGSGTRAPEPCVPETSGLAASAVFAHGRGVNTWIARTLGGSPPAVDAAVLAALLGLAARGHCVLLVQTTRSWKLHGPGATRRFAQHYTWLVQRVDGGRERAVGEGWTEGALLAALDALAGAEPPQTTTMGPYRTAMGAHADADGEGAAVTVPALIRALTAGREIPRGWLKGALRAEARWARTRGTPVPEIGDALGRELTRFLGDPATLEQARALLVQVQAGLACGEPKPG